MTAKKPAVVCLSGGLDSTGLLLHLLAAEREVFGLSFNYGQKHRVELERLQDNLAYLKSKGLQVEWHLLEMAQIGKLFFSALTNDDWDVPEGHYESENMRQTVVPNRNAIFSSIAYGYALSIAARFETEVDMCLGVHSGDHAIYPDCRPEFYEALYTAFEAGNWDAEKVSLYLPYLHLNKTEILKDASGAIEKLGLDFETIFRNTCTSYSPDADGKSHGLTGSDVERILAFHEFGVPDPVEYRQSWDEVVQQALELEREFRK